MDEIIDRLVNETGIDRDTAAKSVTIILAFLQKEGPADKVKLLLASMPGAEQALAAHKGGGFGLGSLMGGGIMAVGSELMAAGLGMGEIQSVARVVLAHGREKAGADIVNEIVGGIPSLAPFV